MTESEDFDLQGGSAAQGSGEKCAEGRQNRDWREPAQASHFQLHPSLRDAQRFDYAVSFRQRLRRLRDSPARAYCTIASTRGIYGFTFAKVRRAYYI